MRGIAVALMFASMPALACQNSCVIVEVESRRGELFVNGSAGEQPLTDASIVVRSAPATKRRSYCGAAKGKVVKKLKTDSRGQFELGALPAGQYWITYIHPEDGESFLVQIGPHVEEKPFRLVVDGYVASICAGSGRRAKHHKAAGLGNRQGL